MSRKVLIVDDEKSIREILEMSLEDEWTVVTATSGQDGIDVASREKPDLILLDRMMPGMDGLTTLEKLRSNPDTADIPVIFLTARVQTRDMADYQGLHVLGVLSKPFDPMTITDEINEMLGRN